MDSIKKKRELNNIQKCLNFKHLDQEVMILNKIHLAKEL